MAERFFAPCPRGLEGALAAELAALGASDVAATDGGAAFAGALALAYHANLNSRIASRILWRVGGGPYRDERDLYALVHAIDWQRHFAPSRTLRVDVAATRSPLASLEFATLRIKDAVCDRFRAERNARPSVDKRSPDVRVHAYLTDREAIVYLDTSGEPLFKRGYRRDGEEAPLRENLAAGLLALAGWTPALPLLDPMCGSGNDRHRGGADRRRSRAGPRAHVRLPEARLVRRPDVAADEAVGARPPAPGAAFAVDLRERHRAGSDRQGDVQLCDAAQVDVVRSRRNGRLAARAMRRRRSGILLTNPPYGVRLDDQKRLAELYPRLGDALKQPVRRLDRALLHRRPAPAEADPPQGRAAGSRSTTARWSAGCSPSRWWPARCATPARRRW